MEESSYQEARQEELWENSCPSCSLTKWTGNLARPHSFQIS